MRARSRSSTIAVALLSCTSCYMSHALEGDRDTETDTEPDVPPIDTDHDCLFDGEETGIWGTNPLVADTDGDGLTDWQEAQAGSDPLDPTNGGDSNSPVVVLPYMASGEEHRTLAVTVDLEIADVYFLIDTTGSMSSAIMNVATSLAGTIVPAITEAIPDAQMGLGHFNDVPYEGFGDAMDQPFWHSVDVTGDVDVLQDALDDLYLSPTWGSGGDTAESQAIALFLTATDGPFHDCSSSVPERTCPTYPGEDGPRRGYPCFRPDSVPIVVVVTDAPWHNGPTGEYPYGCSSIGYASAVSELNDLGARVLGVFVDNFGMEGLEALQRAAIETGAVDGAGAPLVQVATSGGGVSTGIVDMIETLATAGPQDVTTIAVDEPGDPPGAEYDATLFLAGMGTLEASPPGGISHMDATTFYDVMPETVVSFDVAFRNTTIPPGDTTKIFKVWVLTVGDSGLRVGATQYTIVVPPVACSR